MTRQISAGIVVYNPDIKRLKENISAILPQVCKLFIIDNASENIDCDEELFLNKKIHYLRNKKNYGIARALNQMCSIAEYEGFDWLLTLDQDTICPDNLINKLLPFTDNPKIGLVCPRFLIRQSPTRSDDREKVPYEFIDFCITSGSLTRLSIWRQLNGFNEWLFIDCVDYEYCLILRKAQYLIVQVNSVVIDHIVGTPRIFKLPFGKIVRLYNHSPMRNYFIVRNNIYLARRYKSELKGKFWLCKLLYIELLKLLFEKNRKQTFKSLLIGIRDGRSASIDNIKADNQEMPTVN